MPEISKNKHLTMMGWDDVPHLDEKEMQTLLDSTPPHLHDARRYGIPSMGVGAIYPIAETEIIIDPFEIPDYWPRVAGMDVGWNRTACVWGARDRNAQITYLYSEYYRGEAEPAVHVHGIRSRGDWIPIAIDPAARGRGQKDGAQLFQDYTDLGLDLIASANALEAGIYEVWQMLSEGRLKVFRTLQNWLMEYRLYRRDEKGKVVAEMNHLMDSTRYLVLTGLDHAIIQPKPRKNVVPSNRDANEYTGY